MDDLAQEAPELFAYLDHNILDSMTKGDPKQVKELLKEHKLTPVYSDESLKEIHRSKGYEQTFIDLFEKIGAKFIEPVLGENFKATGQAQIQAVCPKQKYEQFLQNQHENPEGDFGFGDLLAKFYGGKPDTSFEDAIGQPIESAMQQLLIALDNVPPEEIPEEMLPHIAAARAMAPELPALLKAKTAEMTTAFDNMTSSPMASFEEHTGIGASILKNITPPNVVQQVWDLVSDKIGSDAIELETFFGIKPQPYDAEPDRERTLQEKVNAIYHQLNFLGYYRDSGMKKERRFKASFSDMTHAGIAAFCHVFICRDGDMVMKTKAAYDYLGVGTQIVFYPTEKQMESDMVAQFKRYAESAAK